MGKKEGGRTLNPADKLRKEQRIKEQKKNAERRAATRAAIVGQKTEEELRSQLASLRKAEAEGRADGKQMQVKKQIEERLAALEKEEAEKVEAPKSLEEQYPDAQGSIYYHPIDNPYGVPPPGCFPMWKPGYIPKAQRQFLPLDHPLHPSYQPPNLRVAPPFSHHAPSPPSEENLSHMDVDLDELNELNELDELEGIPLPPDDPGSDGDLPPPAPPTTEDDLPNIVYDDDIEMDADDDPSAYFMLEEDEDDHSDRPDLEMRAPPSKRGAPPPRSDHFNHHRAPARSAPHGNGPPHLRNAPPPFPNMPFPPGLPPFPFPPPGMPPFGHGVAPHPPHGHRDANRGRGGPMDRNRGRTNPSAPGAIPDPLDLGPLKKEGKSFGDAVNPAASSPASTSTASSSNHTTGSVSSSSPQTGPDTSYVATTNPMLVPSALRIKRKVPVEARPVAPRAAVVVASSSSASTQPAQPQPNGSYEQFLSDMKQMGAL